MRLFSEIEKEYKRVRDILDRDDDEEDIDKRLTCCERATWEAWAEALTFCMYEDGQTP